MRSSLGHRPYANTVNWMIEPAVARFGFARTKTQPAGARGTWFGPMQVPPRRRYFRGYPIFAECPAVGGGRGGPLPWGFVDGRARVARGSVAV